MKKNSAVHERLKKYAGCEATQIIADLNLSHEGYTDIEAERARQGFGTNSSREHSNDTVLYRLRRAFINPFTLILFVLACVSFLTDVLLAGSFARNLTTVAIIVAMLLISGILRFAQEMRAKCTADHLTHLVETTVQVKRNGTWRELPSEELVVGDQIRFSAGDRIPADLRLTATKDLFVSQSVITGESAILEKRSSALNASPKSYAEYCNLAFMGSSVIGGSGEGIVLAVGTDTVYGSITHTDNPRKNGFDRGANSIAWVLIRFMAILVPVVFLACGLTKGNWFSAFIFALSVAVGLTPELLPMVINACLAKGSSAMGKKQTVVKNINAMQSFGSMDILCVDKTGTLTGDTVSLEYYMDILGNESERTLQYAYLNSLYHSGVTNHLDSAILKYNEMPIVAGLAGKFSKLDELPFGYDRRFASILVCGDSQNLLLVKGSVKDVCRRCAFAEYRGESHPMDLSSVYSVVDEMTEDGMKVLAVAYKVLDSDTVTQADEFDLTLIGYLAFFDAPKQSADAAIKMLRERHVGVRVLTGDQKNVALSICHRLGIETDNVLTGAELDALDENEQSLRIENTTVFAELSPKHKVQIVSTLQENGHTVGFLGDGMNDLPAIVEADVGISVDTAAEAVKESADVILLKKDLAVLDEGIVEGRKAFSNMSKYIRITASSNFGNILSIVVASVFLPFFPMTSVQLLLLNLLYDTLCLVLPWDKVDSEDLCRPAEWTGRTLGRFMRFFGPISSVFDLLTFGFLFFVLCPWLCGGRFGMLNSDAQVQFIALFQTGWFLESMWTQVLILHLLRTRKTPILQSKPSAAVMWVTILGIALFTVLSFTPLGSLIGLTPMPSMYFAFLLAVVLLYLLMVTVFKRLYLRKYRELI